MSSSTSEAEASYFSDLFGKATVLLAVGKKNKMTGLLFFPFSPISSPSLSARVFFFPYLL
jgi:hypothetical protein